MANQKFFIKAGPLRGRGNLVPQKVVVRRRTGTDIETRLVNPNKAAKQGTRGSSGVQAGAWGNEQVPVAAHIKQWQDAQVQRVEAFAAQHKIPLNSDVVRFTIQKVRTLSTNNDVHNFIDKHTAGRSGIKMASFPHERQIEPGEQASNQGGWSPPAGYTYLGAKKSPKGAYEFWYDRPGQKGRRALKAPPSDHPDYGLYKEQAGKVTAEKSPYLHKYKSFPELSQYPPADTHPRDVTELSLRDPKRVHMEAALSYKDRSGKVQYCYTRLYHEAAQCRKFVELSSFAQAYPRIMQQVKAGLGEKPGSQSHALATIVGLVDRFGFRVGQEEGQEGIGVTLFQKQHVKVNEDSIDFDFTGKKGVQWERTLKKKADPALFDAVRFYYKRAAGKNGYLFQAPKKGEESGRINNNMVNGWLKKVQESGLSEKQKKGIGSGISVKDFRTYHATNLMRKKLSAILNMPLPRERKAARAAVRAEFDKAAEEVASFMGHTKKVLLDNYVDPAVVKYFEHRAGGNYQFIKSLRGEVGGEHEDFVTFLKNIEHDLYGGNAVGYSKHLERRRRAGFNPHRDQDQLPAIY